jgi:hypothetical protein
MQLYGADRMIRPPSTMDHSERGLSSTEIAESLCTNLVRRVVGDRPGIVMSSERV